MRAVAFAAAGAAVITTVSASSHVKHMHAKLHHNVARDNWVDWIATSATVVEPKATTTSKAPVKAATTSSSTWEDWTSTTSLAVDPAKTSTTSSFDWADWEASKTSTTKKPVSPTTTSTETWGDWDSDVVDPASTSTVTWADWESSAVAAETTTVTKKSTKTVTDYETWAAVDPTSTATTGWGDWVEPTTTVTVASTKTTTKYVEPLSTDSSTWADWESLGAVPVAAASTAEAHSCIVSIITSYGAPTWYPTPAAAAAANTTSTWADWTSTTTKPAAAVITSASSSVWSDWVSTSSAPVSVAASAAWTGAWGAASSPSAAASSASSGWGSSGSGSGSGSKGGAAIHANGNSLGLTYSPYTAQGGCKDAGTVAADLAVIAQKGFSSVRVYSTDCSTLQNIGTSARNNGLKIILGVWISSSGIGGAQGQVSDIVNWAQWDLVDLIVVGNEAVFNGYASAGQLAGFISSSASAFKAAGYTGAVTTTEPLSVWQDSSNSGAFCSAVDVVGANLYAFFNAQVTADMAGNFIQSEIDILDGICNGKPVYVLESGWPHSGNCNGAACPSPQNQATALKGIQAVAGAQVVFLSYEDEPWKEPGQFDVEQFWGCAGVF